jgi:hypothetical protein
MKEIRSSGEYGRAPRIGETTLSAADVREMPGAFGDAFRAVANFRRASAARTWSAWRAEEQGLGRAGFVTQSAAQSPLSLSIAYASPTAPDRSC